ncbi:MAG: PH domain-containing protein [Pseudomonadota bacterium]|nr:PH domain-containing protein [Pseudomonadota bacterium]
MIDPDPHLISAPDSEHHWQHLPDRARLLFAVGSAVPASIAMLFIGAFAARLALRLGPIGGDGLVAGALGAVAGASLGAALGAWWGAKRFGFTQWRHDPEGLALRRGRLWQQETRVPATRVQHLDIKRGPWQRRRGLSTLIVHTAGTRNNAVTVPHLDVDDAERLRDLLARQVDEEVSDG